MAEEKTEGDGAPFILKAIFGIILFFIVWHVTGGVERGEQRLAEGRNALWVRYESNLPSTEDSPNTSGFIQPDVVQVKQRHQE